jgi:outer membrane protein OmpU
MNNIKKIGLTALAASLVSTSVFAGDFAVTGAASMTVENYGGEKVNTGKAFSMGNQLTFAGSGELDNGLNVSASFTLDQGDDTSTIAGTATAPIGGGAPFDSHSVTISSDAIGTIVFHGEGGDSAQNAVGDTAAGNIWDNFDGQQTGAAKLAESDATTNMIHYTLPAIVDGLTLAASYVPQGTDDEAQTAYGITYTGLVDGLTLKYGVGDDNDGTGALSNAKATSIAATYAYGSLTFAYSDHEYDHETVTSSQDAKAMKLSYTVSDAISVSYGEETINSNAAAAVQDAEYSKISASYTSGGMTVTVTSQEADNMNYTTTSTMDQDYWSLGLAFAF